MKLVTKKVTNIALALIGIAITANVILFIMNKSPFNLIRIDETRTVKSSGVMDIYLFSNTGDIKVLSHDEDEIIVRMVGKSDSKSSDNYQLNVMQDGSRVTIDATEAKKKKLFSIYPGEYELEVLIPNSKLSGLHVRSETADINIQLQAIQYDIEATSEYGNIKVITKEAPNALRTELSTGLGTRTVQLPNVVDGAVGEGGPVVRLSSSIGDLIVTMEGL